MHHKYLLDIHITQYVIKYISDTFCSTEISFSILHNYVQLINVSLIFSHSPQIFFNSIIYKLRNLNFLLFVRNKIFCANYKQKFWMNVR